MTFYKGSSNIFYIYFQIIKKYNDYMETSLKEYNFTPGEIAVLTFLANNEDRENTASDISSYRGLSKGLISRTVHLLLEKELIITKENKKDRRSVYLEISANEDKLLKELQDYSINFKNKLSENIDIKDLEIFDKVNTNILKNLEDI